MLGHYRIAVVTIEVAKTKKKYASEMLIIFTRWLNNWTSTRYTCEFPAYFAMLPHILQLVQTPG